MGERAHFGGLTRRDRPAVGWRPTVRFTFAVSFTTAYVAFAVWASTPWRNELEDALGPVMAWVIPISLAYVPATVIGFMIFTLLLTRYHEPDLPMEWPAVTVIVAARNEETGIEETIAHLGRLTYPGPLEVVLADNGSTDATVARAAIAAGEHGLRFRCVPEPEPGKHRALNTALPTVDTPVLVTVDADTWLHPEALTFLVARIAARPQDQHVAACAGALVAANSQATYVTRMQSWDYRLGINGVKRMQAAYNSTLVAQGAFSAYWTSDLRAVGGWPDAIGEDIVLTWTLMASRGLAQYEPVALSFTVVPERTARLTSQRSRWARGMFEGLRANPPRRQPRVLAKFVAGIDYLVPVLDVGYIFFWIPGFVLFVLGYPLIVGWWSMLLIPITLVLFGFMRRWQERHVFRRLGIHTPHDVLGFLGYLFVFQAVTSAAALRGYGQYVLGSARRWE